MRRDAKTSLHLFDVVNRLVKCPYWPPEGVTDEVNTVSENQHIDPKSTFCQFTLF